MKTMILWVTGFGLLFPLFFQLSGRIYNSAEPIWDSGGMITQLPLPVSLPVCCCSLLLLAAHHRQAALALKVVAAMALTMVVSLVLAGPAIESRKVIMLIQVLLPMSGLVLGQMIEDEEQILPRAFLWVLTILVPVQLLAGWVRGNPWLTHDLYFFSIYQHFQFVPLVLVCGFAYAMSRLWNTHKATFYILTPLMLIYTFESLSLLSIFAFVAFVVAFTLVRSEGRKAKGWAILLVAVAIAGLLVHWAVLKNVAGMENSVAGQFSGKFQTMERGETPRNVQDRLGDWKLYGAGIVESGRAFLLGHPAPFPREVKTSAHNWYLDVAYNFGVIALMPVVFLIGYTSYLLWQGREALPAATCWLAAIVFYLVIVDSNMKVTLRQPYPGIFAYFLWGMLLSRLAGVPRECKRSDRRA
ncbi:MAG TPA: O-antigen ligase family protein [Candidatus Latescibacteria bacterium]|nr:O-antigen ligase family protein [Candidatus Latescibacterota bacterium]